MSVFFFGGGGGSWGMNQSAGQSNHVRFSGDLFVPRSDSFPMNQEKKGIHSFYLQCFQQKSFLKFSEKNYKFKILQEWILNFIWCINYCTSDLPNCWTTCWPWFIRNLNENVCKAQQFRKYNTIVNIVTWIWTAVINDYIKWMYM